MARDDQAKDLPGYFDRVFQCPTYGRQVEHASTPLENKPYGPATSMTPAPTDHQESHDGILSVNEGDDLELEEKDRIPYVLVENLGHGASANAIVEMVRDINTNQTYARKVFRNYHTRKLQEAKKAFQNELRVMRRLQSHHHMMRVFATYVTKRELALILTPVADTGDLAAFIQNYRDTNPASPEKGTREAILWKAFGCLAAGLAFIHQQTIRHKDIKPQNILIHQGNVLFTDFGIAFDFSEHGRSTTTGRPHSYTRRYCAPEVADFAERKSKSDVFSLGCVYAEILDALRPDILPDAFLKGPFHQTLEHFNPTELPSDLPNKEAYQCILQLIRKMLAFRVEERISALDAERLLPSVLLGIKFFCNSCCPGIDNDKISVSLESSFTAGGTNWDALSLQADFINNSYIMKTFFENLIVPEVASSSSCNSFSSSPHLFTSGKIHAIWNPGLSITVDSGDRSNSDSGYPPTLHSGCPSKISNLDEEEDEKDEEFIRRQRARRLLKCRLSRAGFRKLGSQSSRASTHSSSDHRKVWTGQKIETTLGLNGNETGNGNTPFNKSDGSKDGGDDNDGNKSSLGSEENAVLSKRGKKSDPVAPTSDELKPVEPSRWNLRGDTSAARDFIDKIGQSSIMHDIANYDVYESNESDFDLYAETGGHEIKRRHKYKPIIGFLLDNHKRALKELQRTSSLIDLEANGSIENRFHGMPSGMVVYSPSNPWSHLSTGTASRLQSAGDFNKTEPNAIPLSHFQSRTVQNLPHTNPWRNAIEQPYRKGAGRDQRPTDSVKSSQCEDTINNNFTLARRTTSPESHLHLRSQPVASFDAEVASQPAAIGTRSSHNECRSLGPMSSYSEAIYEQAAKRFIGKDPFSFS